MERFSRIHRLLGDKRFRRLQEKRVTVVGLGAVGGYVVEGLARAGISTLRLIDYDTIQPTNLNRQILALESTLGRLKADAARERVLQINPQCNVEALPIFAADETLDDILSPAPDLLIDAIDSLNPKVQLLAGAYERQIPTLSSMGAALRTDPSRIRLADIFDTDNCPLARLVRKRLRRRNIGRGIRCVFSNEKVDFDYSQASDEEQVGETPYSERGRERNVLGSLPTVTGIFGLILANEAIMQLSSDTGPVFQGEK
ncbi:tRNA threonylcarbamoyladenosine dehydratase [Desulfopila aestuarii]|uniref:tRNA A37 threonylcarbamoyladenosine dehydratase n=1 Tax=Desulfopila aestuarii DSM 18488 TaxID=1121416 RepID=A0A1M7Y754_9BACT|nr:tRNA threonylcarbamoyladenosine dehydratase [Desulfopila aestuarii]SHO48348.1 tRNA A37 threonylcarbamoyladenosine dehydratase [Desulfopila aestuarii DSM 18488]